MSRAKRLLAGLGGAVAIVLCAAVSADAQQSIGERYGIGAEGTIGRGTDILPGGPWDEYASSGYGGVNGGGVTYEPPVYRVQPPRAPYLTNRFYTPGDGYRYQLYYNPGTRTYFYYPVRR